MQNSKTKNAIQCAILGLIYGTVYVFIEILYRGYSHWTMFLLASVIGVMIGLINELKLTYNMPLIKQCIIGGFAATLGELIFGIIFNIMLGMNIWDYSKLPFNFLGQICLYFYFAWCGLSLVCIVVDDWLRYLIWKEERPKYTLF